MMLIGFRYGSVFKGNHFWGGLMLMEGIPGLGVESSVVANQVPMEMCEAWDRGGGESI